MMRQKILITLTGIIVFGLSQTAMSLSMTAINLTSNNDPIANAKLDIIIVNHDRSFKNLLNSVVTLPLETDANGHFELDYPVGTAISGTASYPITRKGNKTNLYCNGNITDISPQGTMGFECYFLGN